MSVLTLELPNSLQKKLEVLARNGGFSVEQFLASAASEKVSAMLQLDFLGNEAQLGSKEAFEDYLANVPSTPPIQAEDAVK